MTVIREILAGIGVYVLSILVMLIILSYAETMITPPYIYTIAGFATAAYWFLSYLNYRKRR
jgi:hypothetical protein